MAVEQSQSRILVVGPSWVGDMVMAQSLFKLLAAQHPGLLLDVLAPAWAAPVLARMPEVRRSIHMPVGHGKLQLRQRYRLGVALRAEQYDQAILLPNSFKSALLPFFARIPQRTGWRGEMRYGLLNDMRRLDVERYPLMVQRFAALGLAPNAALPADLPRPLLLTAADQQQELRARLQLHPQRPVLGLCPGAEFGPAKQWPASHYAALAQHYIGQGWQVVALGSARDQASAAAIRDVLTDQAANHYRDATGSTSLIDAVDLLALCRAVVSNDSGLMHIAAAVGSALVAVYGSTSPAFTPPLADRVAVAAIDLPCRPCFQRQCPLGHLNCLVQLGPDLVIRQLDGLLSALEARECN